MYIGLGLAIIAFFVLSFFNKAVFGGKTEIKDYAELENFKNGVFANQSETLVMSPEGNFFKILKEWLNKAPDNEPKNVLPVIKTDLKQLQDNNLVWFGHSSYLMRVNGKNILVDPVFNRASPVKMFGKPFKTTYNYTAADFETVDFLVITHDHYDHLDYETIKTLLPKTNQIVTGLGVEKHLIAWGAKAENINSLNWFQQVQLQDFTFTALPARHFSGRKFKRGETLWSSFALKTPEQNIYIGGDSGYDTHFKKIGEQFGPFDLAILECGQYGKYWPNIHMFPKEVLIAAKDLKAKKLLPVHWAKFSLSVHGWTEPIENLIENCTTEDCPVLTPALGEVISLTETNSTEYWWR